MIVLGVTTWLLVALATVLGISAKLTLIDLLLLLGPLAVVPLGLRVAERQGPWPPWLVFGAGVLLVPSFLLPSGTAAGLLTAPWSFVGIGVALDGLADARRGGSWSPVSLARPLAGVWLFVGAASVTATRVGLSGLGIEEPIVELTAVHYHFGGFAAAILAWRTAKVATPLTPRLATIMAALVAWSPPVIAAGFVTKAAVLQVGGGVLLTLGLWLLAGLVLVLVAPVLSKGSALLLRFSAVSVVVPMALAVSWAAGQFSDVPALSIPDMALTHGVVNAFGFVLCGLSGWLIHDAVETRCGL